MRSFPALLFLEDHLLSCPIQQSRLDFCYCSASSFALLSSQSSSRQFPIQLREKSSKFMAKLNSIQHCTRFTANLQLFLNQSEPSHRWPRLLSKSYFRLWPLASLLLPLRLYCVHPFHTILCAIADFFQGKNLISLGVFHTEGTAALILVRVWGNQM